MRRSLLLFLALLAGFPLHADESLVDDRGVTLEIERPAQRIVSLAPHLTEQLFAIGAGDRIVGTSEYSDWPPAAEDIPRVGNAFRFDLERIVALQPDVILAWSSGTPKGVVEQLEHLGLPVAVIASPDMDTVANNLRWLGRLTGQEDTARAVAEKFLVNMHRIETEHAGKQTLNVFYQISSQPLFTVNGEHSISSIIEICGGVNIFAGLAGAVAPAVSREAVMARNPDVIVGGKESVTAEGAGDWSNWPKLNAVRYDNVIAVNAVLLARPTPRLVEGAEELCAALEKARRNIEQGHRAAGTER